MPENFIDNSTAQTELYAVDQNLQIFIKSKLKDRLFAGSFQEKRYIADLNTYRSVVLIDKNEHELINDLEIIIGKLQSFDKWVGITTPNIIGAPAGYCLWVDLEEEIFGSFWFQIRSIKFKQKEISIKLKKLRPITQTTVDRNTTLDNSSEQLPLEEPLTTLRTMFVDNMNYLFQNIMTIQNTKQAIVFFGVLFMALFSGIIQLIQFSGEFTLRLIREVSNLLHASTPIVISIINMIGKIIGGFYLLIAMMWRDGKQPTTPALSHANYKRLAIEGKSMNYRPSSARFQEIR